MASKIIIENYKKGIVSDSYKVFYCKESDEYFVRKIVDPKPRQKPLTKTERNKIIEYFIENQSSPEGYNVYYCSDISDYKIVKQNKSLPIAECEELNLNLSVPVRSASSPPVVVPVKGSVIEDKKGADFGSDII